MAKAKRAAGYLRRSTKGQEASIKDQKAACLEYAKRYNIEIVRWYIDDGISGDATEKRHGFLKMRDDADSGEFDMVLCWDQERFGRFDSLDAGHWIYPFRKAGVTLVTVKDGSINWEDFTTRLMYGIKQEGKHQFLRDLSQNVLRGQIEAAKAGSWIGTAPYAYKIVGEKKNKRLEVADETKANIVRRIFKEFVEEGRSMTQIARRLTRDKFPSSGGRPRWRADAIKVILENPAYVGTYRYNSYSYAKYFSYRNGQITPSGGRGRKPESDWIVKPNNHPAIVGKAIYNRAQAILAKGKTGRSTHTQGANPYLLGGVLRCGKCGKPMWGMNSKTYRYYECSTRKRDGDEACVGTTVREDAVMDRLVSYIQNEFLGDDDQQIIKLWQTASKGKLLKESELPKSFKKLKRMMLGKDKPKTDFKAIERQIASLDANIAKARRNLAHVDGPENVKAVQEEIAALVAQREHLQCQVQSVPTEQDINQTVLKVFEKLYDLATLSRNDLRPLMMQVDRITVHTQTKGRGVGARHKFKRAEVCFAGVGPVTDKLNPHRPG